MCLLGGGGQHSYGWHHPTHKALPHSSILSAWLTPHCQWHPSPPLISLFLIPLIFLSLHPTSHSCWDSVFLQTMLFTAGLSPTVEACYRWLLSTGAMARANQKGADCSNHRAECLARHRLSQSEWLVARHPEVKGEGRGRFQPMKRLLPQQPGISGYHQTRQGVNTITHTRTH